METTKNKIPDNAKIFFNKLGSYLDTNIYYYGSIQRVDYFPNSSDIDVDIFTDNEKSTLLKIQAFLNNINNNNSNNNNNNNNNNKYKIQKVIYKLHKTNQVVNGYKVKYNSNFSAEISIYNEKYKEAVLLEHNFKMILPFYISALLIILKTIYYNLGLLPKSVYIYTKNFIMDYFVEGQESEFVSLDV